MSRSSNCIHVHISTDQKQSYERTYLQERMGPLQTLHTFMQIWSNIRYCFTDGETKIKAISCQRQSWDQRPVDFPEINCLSHTASSPPSPLEDARRVCLRREPANPVNAWNASLTSPASPDAIIIVLLCRYSAFALSELLSSYFQKWMNSTLFIYIFHPYAVLFKRVLDISL